MQFIVENEATVRLTCFVGGIVLMMLIEACQPRRARSIRWLKRWSTNLGLVVLNSLLLRLATPLLAVGVAYWSAEHGIGLLNIMILPVWLELLLAVIVLDLAVYAQHVASHRVPLLWRLHQVHHADHDLDVTTGVRFHPLEIVVSMAYKLICVVLLGPAVVAVIVFEVLLNASAMFNHANFKLPDRLEALLRQVVVTPDFHRVHHSTTVSETNSNYGFFLSGWDRLFKTFRAQPEAGHLYMQIGLTQHAEQPTYSLWWCLKLPFKRNT